MQVFIFNILHFLFFFKALCVVLSSAQIGVGNTKIVLISGMIGNALNVLLNYLLIFGKYGFPEMGIQGAAIATVIGNAVIFIILLYSVTKGDYGINILKKGSYHFTKKSISSTSRNWDKLFLRTYF